MLNATFSLLFIGAPVLLLGIALAFRRSMLRRRENESPFRGYYASGDDLDFLEHSHLSETEDWRADLQTRFTPFRLRNPEFDRIRERGRCIADQDHPSY